MNDAAPRELLVVLATMAALFVFGLVAVLIFVRTWRKEKGKQ
jgi:hypothetical protein